jgi:hypothetical protein
VTFFTVVQVPVLNALDKDVGFTEFGSAGSFLGASEQLRRIATRVLTGGESITWESPCGSNCSYSISFDGPAYRCQDVDSVPSSLNLSSSGGFVGQSWYVAEGRYTATPQPTVWNGTLDTQGMWIVRNPGPMNVTLCQLYQAKYTANVQYLENTQVVKTSVSLRKQIPGSVGLLDQQAKSPGALNESSWSLMNFFAIEDAVAQLLSGAISLSSVYGGYNFRNTMIGRSNLATIAPFNISYPDDFPRQVEQLLINTTLSLNYFLKNPTISQLGRNNASSPISLTSVPATQTSYRSQYSYSSSTLWALYGTALFITGGCIAIGSYMLVQNGVDSDLSFSQILVTTRNKTLDHECEGAGMGGKYISQALRKMKLRYGELQQFAEGDQLILTNHVGFGMEKEVVKYRKGVVYS